MAFDVFASTEFHREVFELVHNIAAHGKLNGGVCAIYRALLYTSREAWLRKYILLDLDLLLIRKVPVSLDGL